jgi:hypothetical protein
MYSSHSEQNGLDDGVMKDDGPICRHRLPDLALQVSANMMSGY